MTTPGKPQAPSLSAGARVATAALGACGYTGGWLILASGGFHHAPNRYTTETTFVGGAPALAVAAIFFGLATIGVAALLHARKRTWPWYVVGCGAVLLPPLLFALSG